MISAGSNPTVLALGVFLAYASSSAIGLAVVGAFLRQTAKVVVRGMGGNLHEFGSSVSDISFIVRNVASESQNQSFGQITFYKSAKPAERMLAS